MAYLTQADIANLSSIRGSLISAHGTAVSFLLPHGQIRHNADPEREHKFKFFYCHRYENHLKLVTGSKYQAPAHCALPNILDIYVIICIKKEDLSGRKSKCGLYSTYVWLQYPEVVLWCEQSVITFIHTTQIR